MADAFEARLAKPSDWNSLDDFDDAAILGEMNAKIEATFDEVKAELAAEKATKAAAKAAKAAKAAEAAAAEASGSVRRTAMTLFLDCDDCLYRNNWVTANKITESIAAYTQEKLNVDQKQAYALYKQHGTCLKGLLAEGIIDAAGAEDFLVRVHQIDYGDIQPDPALDAILAGLSAPTWIFTASTREHALRCVDALQLKRLRYEGVVDTRTCSLETKHSAASFEAAMRAASVVDPASCVLADDSVKNSAPGPRAAEMRRRDVPPWDAARSSPLTAHRPSSSSSSSSSSASLPLPLPYPPLVRAAVVAAKACGWRTVLVGLTDRDTGEPLRCAAADAQIASLHALPEVMPELFG